MNNDRQKILTDYISYYTQQAGLMILSGNISSMSRIF